MIRLFSIQNAGYFLDKLERIEQLVNISVINSCPNMLHTREQRVWDSVYLSSQRIVARLRTRHLDVMAEILEEGGDGAVPHARSCCQPDWRHGCTSALPHAVTSNRTCLRSGCNENKNTHTNNKITSVAQLDQRARLLISRLRVRSPSEVYKVPLAQLVLERRSYEPKVVGSIPTWDM